MKTYNKPKTPKAVVRFHLMTMSKCLLVLVTLLLGTGTAFGQYKNYKFESHRYYYGFKGGVNYGTINDVKTTIIRPFFPEESFSTVDDGLIGYEGGLFFYYRFEASSVAIQPEITYGIQGGRFKYNDVDDLNYQIDFNYQYLHLATYLKIYPFQKENGALPYYQRSDWECRNGF